MGAIPLEVCWAGPHSLAITAPTPGRPPIERIALTLQPLSPWLVVCSLFMPRVERMIEYLSATPASSGINSQISTPGALVAIGRNSPRYSTGASGLRSKVSM